MSENYSAKDIQVLEGLEAVRVRPGMYIGSVDSRGLHECLREIYDNSIDEALAGYCDTIKISILKDNSAIVSDNGRGIPVDISPTHNVSALELVMTKLHAGGKFGGDGYKVSAGLHGVGAAVANALSSYCRVEVRRDGKLYHQEYSEGIKKYDVKQEEKTTSKIDSKYIASMERGTTTIFTPDLSIMETNLFDIDFIEQRLKMSAFLNKKIKFILIDERNDTIKTFYFEGGLASMISFYNKNKNIIQDKIYHTIGDYNGTEVEVAFQYTSSTVTNELSFANNVRTIEGGTHATGFRTALTKSVVDYAKKKDLIKDNKLKLVGDDIRSGLTVAISVKLTSDKLLFEGQTKNKLGSSEARPAVENIVKESLETFLEENPTEANNIISKCLLSAKARMAAKAARESIIRKNPLGGSGLPSKLADCRTKDADLAELFIVEGDSAGGSAKDARDPEIQAILPLFGKIINSEKSRIDQVLKEPRIEILVQALGSGIGEVFDVKNIRYKKIIIMTDADVDGAHIRTLYLTLLFRHLEPLVLNGYVYAAVPPLYKAIWGKNKQYLDDDEDREAFEQKLKDQGIKNYVISRFKGLGEMDYEELWETTMNPETRVLKQITIDDIDQADQVFEMLMGKEVKPRKNFIMNNARLADFDSHA